MYEQPHRQPGLYEGLGLVDSTRTRRSKPKSRTEMPRVGEVVAMSKIAEVIKLLDQQRESLPNHPNTLNAQALARIRDIVTSAGWLT